MQIFFYVRNISYLFESQFRAKTGFGFDGKKNPARLGICTVGKPENLPKAALSGLPTCQKNNVTHGVPLQQREWYICAKNVPKNIFHKNICFNG